MRRNIPTIFAILLLGSLVLCSACTGPGTEVPQQNTSGSPQPTGGGLVQVTVPSEPSRIGFDTALQRLRAYTTVSFNETSADTEKIHYILAKDVDNRGNAVSWIFGVKNGSSSRLVIFDRTGSAEIPSSFPSGEIFMDSFVPPGKVFSDNKEAILGSTATSIPEQREFEVKDGIYTIIIKSANTVRVIRINAATGALMV
jgi:hypothetical protein